MEQALIDFLVMLAAKYPLVLTAFAVMGVLRAIMKPLFSLFHTLTEATASKKDDEILEKVEASKFYKWFVYILDWFASVKIK